MTETLDPERALVGAVLADCKSPADVLEVVKSSDFSDPWLEVVWDAVGVVVNDGRDPRAIAVAKALPQGGAKLPGGLVFLSDLVQCVPFASDAMYYARLVRDGAVKRRIREASIRISQMVDDIADVSELADRARGEIEMALTTAVGHDVVALSSVLPEVMDIAEKGQQAGLTTPWPGLDRIVRGMQPGRLVVVGARPGVGKSLMGTNVAHFVARQHRKAVLFCSMEMPALEVGQRILAHHASVALSSLDEGNVSAASWEKIRTSFAELNNLGIYIEGDAVQTLTSIRSAISKIRRQRDDLAVVVVDYLQLMKPRDTRMNRAEQIGEISRGLKVIAREYGVTVLAMAQVNRASTQRTGGKPTLADLRESGSIEADADVVLLLHRPDMDDGTPGTTIEVLIDKNRSGPRGATELLMVGHYARLSEQAWSPGLHAV